MKNEDWKLNMQELEKTKDTSLQKLMEKEHVGEIGTLLKENGTYARNREESIEELMKTHFPDCSKIIEEDIDDRRSIANKKDWEEIEKTKTPNRIKWAIGCPMPYKAPGEDGIFPAMIQHVQNEILVILQALFRWSLRLNYIPKKWRGTIIAFIPKAGKASYDLAKSFRPISLMSFLLKTLEKLIDRSIRENVIVTSPINKAQHAYQEGKGTESALHSLVTEIEKNIHCENYTITVIIDIEGAFDNTNFGSIVQAAKDKGVKDWTINWTCSRKE
jgi:hypothetical protein